MCPFTYRFMPVARWRKELVNEGYPGRPSHLSLRYFAGNGRGDEVHVAIRPRQGGRGIGSDRVFGRALERGPRPDGASYDAVEDSAMILLQFQSGATGSLHVSVVAYEPSPFGQLHQMELHGRRARSTQSATGTGSSTSTAVAQTSRDGEPWRQWLWKKMAGYHQFHAVNVAVEETLRAADAVSGRPRGGAAGPLRGGAAARRRAGRPARRRRLAHAGLAARASRWRSTPGASILRPGDGEPDARRAHRPQRPRRPALRHVRALPRAAAADAGAGRRAGPTCASCSRSPPAAWSSRRSRSSCPRRRATSIPLLSDRRNIVVIADEAHRSQYDFIDGFARHMRDALPNASFIGFTGTPIEQTDANTRAVFGDYISVYDIQRAVEDRRTVPIYYESRLAKLELNDDGAAEDRRGVRGGHRRRGGRRARRSSRRKWAQLEALVGDREAARR